MSLDQHQTTGFQSFLNEIKTENLNLRKQLFWGDAPHIKELQYLKSLWPIQRRSNLYISTNRNNGNARPSHYP